jgi:TonB family protein
MESNLIQIFKSIGLIIVMESLVSSQNTKPCNDSLTQYVDLENQAIKKVGAAYPAEPGIRVNGTVVIRIVVDKKGNVLSARSICGNPLLVPASVKAAAQWKFQPKRVNGRLSKNVGILVFDFKQVNRERGSPLIRRG